MVSDISHQLKIPVAALDTVDVVAQTAQGVDIAVNALALGQNALIFQQIGRASCRERV